VTGPPATATRDIQQVMTALASPVRREILSLIWDREVAAGEIAAAFALTKPTISEHLAVLRRAGLATAVTAGTSRRYRARHEVLRGLHAALEGTSKWQAADDIPERRWSHAVTRPAVVARVDVACRPGEAFEAFVDPVLYSRWLGVPVTLVDGRFACTLEWGTEVRGRYEIVHPPELIVMRWDFEDDAVPVPGAEQTAYLRVSPRGEAARVEVHQLVESSVQAEFMEAAWSLVLGRLASGLPAALDPGAPAARRPPRRKRRTPG